MAAFDLHNHNDGSWGTDRLQQEIQKILSASGVGAEEYRPPANAALKHLDANMLPTSEDVKTLGMSYVEEQQQTLQQVIFPFMKLQKQHEATSRELERSQRANDEWKRLHASAAVFESQIEDQNGKLIDLGHILMKMQADLKAAEEKAEVVEEARAAEEEARKSLDTQIKTLKAENSQLRLNASGHETKHDEALAQVHALEHDLTQGSSVSPPVSSTECSPTLANEAATALRTLSPLQRQLAEQQAAWAVDCLRNERILSPMAAQMSAFENAQAEAHAAEEQACTNGLSLADELENAAPLQEVESSVQEWMDAASQQKLKNAAGMMVLKYENAKLEYNQLLNTQKETARAAAEWHALWAESQAREQRSLLGRVGVAMSGFFSSPVQSPPAPAPALRHVSTPQAPRRSSPDADVVYSPPRGALR